MLKYIVTAIIVLLTISCIRSQEDPICDDIYEEYKCSTQCKDVCPIFQEDFECGGCNYGCYCKEGYVRHPKKGCITRGQCFGCGLHEDYYISSACLEACNHADCHEPLIYGCWCENGFQRERNGTCVPRCDCKPCSSHESFECGIDCQRQCNPPSVTEKIPGCTYGCHCSKGYLRDDNGQCIQDKHCQIVTTPTSTTTTTTTTTCGEDEEYKCSNTCQETCWPPNEEVACINNCTYGCYCKEGFKRNVNNLCVPATECHQLLCGDNEVYKCGTNCTEACSIYPSPPCAEEQCTDGCYCADGFKRIDNYCKPEDQCSNCPLNEIPGCSNGCSDSCNIDTLMMCPDYCDEGGCVCADGFCRDDNTQTCVQPFK